LPSSQNYSTPHSTPPPPKRHFSRRARHSYSHSTPLYSTPQDSNRISGRSPATGFYSTRSTTSSLVPGALGSAPASAAPAQPKCSSLVGAITTRRASRPPYLGRHGSSGLHVSVGPNTRAAESDNVDDQAAKPPSTNSQAGNSHSHHSTTGMRNTPLCHFHQLVLYARRTSGFMMIRGGLSGVGYSLCKSYENKKHSEWSHASTPDSRNLRGRVSVGDMRLLGYVAVLSAS
jgi:hypothetical protein